MAVRSAVVETKEIKSIDGQPIVFASPVSFDTPIDFSVYEVELTIPANSTQAFLTVQEFQSKKSYEIAGNVTDGITEDTFTVVYFLQNQNGKLCQNNYFVNQNQDFAKIEFSNECAIVSNKLQLTLTNKTNNTLTIKTQIQ